MTKKFGIPEFIKSLDMFSKPLPSFNISGKTSVPTSVGACSTISIVVLTLSFALLKMQHLINRKNPILVENTNPLEIDETYSLGNDEF